MIFALNISLISIEDGAQNLVRLLEVQQIRTLKLTRFSFQKSSHLLGILVEKIHINSQHHAAGLKIRQINPTMKRFRYRYVAVLILTCLSSFLFLGE